MTMILNGFLIAIGVALAVAAVTAVVFFAVAIRALVRVYIDYRRKKKKILDERDEKTIRLTFDDVMSEPED